MALISLRDVELAFGAQPLLDAVTFHLNAGERVALLGRNGAGKSSLMKIVAGELMPDAGVIDRSPGLRVGMLAQDVPEGEGSVREVVRGGSVDASFEAERRVEKVLSRLALDPEAGFASLSAGMKRRVLLGRALASEPQLLLLDEPTNHLDIASVTWLEDFLARFGETLLLVSHDRAFLQRLATRVVELDRGRLIDFNCGYRAFVERRERLLLDEERAALEQDKKLAAEEAWIRKGIEARRTRNQGRVRALERLRAERRARRDKPGSVRMRVAEAERSGKLVVEAEGVSVGYGDRAVVRGLSTLVMRGDKVGVVGPNGCGKTTLLKVLLGQLEPSAGKLRLGHRLEIAYFDQLREELDADKTVADNVAEGADRVVAGGQSRHVLGYLEDWLFSPDRARTPVAALSGGEKNRLLLARLFLKPSNVLVLDEPTNDLDIETLELLESRLVDYGGTVLVVSHDRSFLDNVVGSTLVYEGDGRFVEYAGGYSDYVAQKAGGSASAGETPRAEGKAKGQKAKTAPARKLSFKEQRELEALPARIEALEAELRELHDKLGNPELYQSAGTQVAEVTARLEALGAELEQAYARWEELEAVRES